MMTWYTEKRFRKILEKFGTLVVRSLKIYFLNFREIQIVWLFIMQGEKNALFS